MRFVLCLLLLGACLSVEYLSVEKERELAAQFPSEAEEYCFPPCTTDKPLSERHRSIKVANYYSLVDKHIANIAGLMGVKKNDLKLTEGHTMGAYDKVRTLNRLADDPRIHNICEIGFNAGHSSLNFLAGNFNASLISFDIFWHAYTPLAVRSLKSLFPLRRITSIAGSSTDSVPDFTALVGEGFKCQLIFIDGGHIAPIFEADLRNMRALADPAYHVVILDDMQLDPLRAVYEQQWLATGKMRELERHRDIRSSAFASWRLSGEGGTHYEFDFGSGDMLTRFPGVEEIAVAQFVF